MDKFTIYYRKSFDGYVGVEDSILRFWELYVPVMILEDCGLGDVFMMMQGEIWSPHGEAREAIKALGLSHTSMSVGDVAYSHSQDKYYMAKNIGWLILPVDKE